MGRDGRRNPQSAPHLGETAAAAEQQRLFVGRRPAPPDGLQPVHLGGATVLLLLMPAVLRRLRLGLRGASDAQETATHTSEPGGEGTAKETEEQSCSSDGQRQKKGQNGGAGTTSARFGVG